MEPGIMDIRERDERSSPELPMTCSPAGERRPPSDFMRYLAELVKRKDLLLYLVTSGLKAQHRNSFLGYFWWLLDPLLGILIYYFVVVIIFKRGGEGYGAFLVVGMIVWRWVNSTISSSSKSIVGQAGIITQVYLPKVIFPLGQALTQTVNFGFGLIIIVVFVLGSGIRPGPELLWLPYIMLMQLAMSVAMGLVLAYICSFVRDIDTLVGHLTRLWFFFTPVVWQPNTIPARLRWLNTLNPMTHFLDAYRRVFLYGTHPEVLAITVVGLASVALTLVMFVVYSQHEHRIIKVL